MKHIIVGSGVIGKATGEWLIANNYDVVFYDKNKKVLDSIKKEKRNVIYKLENSVVDDSYNVFVWICTAEWNTEEALKETIEFQKQKKIGNVFYVIRSTTYPGTTENLREAYSVKFIAHNPEFLREKTAINDMFNPDRVVIGTSQIKMEKILKEFYEKNYTNIVCTDSTSSELIKLASNCWLATQITYWNEIKKIADKLNLNPQEIANVCTLDKRISKYGTNMLGKPFSGFCLPKDTKALDKLFLDNKINSDLLHLIIKLNEESVNEK